MILNSPLASALLQPLAGGPFTHWLSLLRRHGGCDRQHIAKACWVTLLTALMTPLRLLEHAKYDRRVQRQKILHPPVFIIGHWRTGTTYLHNLLCEDPNHAFVSTLQTIAPEFFLVGHRVIRAYVARLMPKTRPQDNLELSLDYPMEEEIALINLTPYTFYQGWFFPRHMDELFKYTTMENVPDEAVDHWKQTYITLLKKATFAADGRRLALKNPVNTARIPLLLELFPDAKFIHIYRNPYVVFPSTKRLYMKMLPMSALQHYTEEEMEQRILKFYSIMMQRFFRDRSRIPQGNLAEVRFETFEQNPLNELERVYDQLGLPFGRAMIPLQRYIDSQRGYRKNVYNLDESTLEKVRENWAFALDAWGYEPPA